MTAQTTPPALTAAQMAEVDRIMIDELGIELLQMMENAGATLARLARDRFLAGRPAGRRVTVLAGTGGNGGGALAAGRRLMGWGAEVELVLVRAPADYVGAPRRQLEVLTALGAPIREWPRASREPPELVIDGVLGYSLNGPPRGAAGTVVQSAGEAGSSLLAVDVPSGLDATTGEVHEPAVAASATLALALPKTGLLAPGARAYVGELYLADIGVPPSVYARPGLDLAVEVPFTAADIVRLA